MEKWSKIKIEAGIFMPPPARGGRSCSYPFQNMRFGDSFFMLSPGDSSAKALRSSAYRYGKRYGKKYTVRKEKDGFRCWRIE
jgi:hypothetical protein